MTDTPRRAPRTAPDPTTRDSVRGTAALTRSLLRRGRVRLPVWIGSITLYTVWFGSALPSIYADEAERQVRAALFTNPAMRSFVGPGYGLDDYTFGAMLGNEMLGMTSLAFALMAILLTVRHTRAEEESGQAELVRSMVVGRHAPAAASLIVVVGAVVTTGLLIAVGLGALGVESIDWAGSFLFGAALSSVGIVFAGVATVTSQIMQSARGASGLAGGIFAVAYFLRGAGDMATLGGGALSWASPIGWAQQTQPYVTNRWWPLLLSLATGALLILLSARVNERRDLGASLIQARGGRAEASGLLASPSALAWRLQRTWVAWWSASLLVFGVLYGTVTSEVERFVDEVDLVDEWLGDIGGDSVIDSWLALLLMLIALTVAIFAVGAALRLRGEETTGLAEPMLALPLSRGRWAASHLGVAFAGSAVVLVAAATGIGLTAGVALDRPALAADLVIASLAWLPPIWLTVSAGVALFGLVPRATTLVWLVIGYALVVGMFGPLLGLPDWAANLSPFSHVPMLPAEEMRWQPIAVMTAASASLITAGLAGLHSRDLRSPT